MESKKVLLLLLVAMVLLVNVVIVAAFTNKEVDTNEGPKQKITPERKEAVSHQQVKSRFLSQDFFLPSIPDYQTITESIMTCDKSPQICSTNGSTRPDCCDKRCVNTQRNVLNCGKCGNKCYYTEICCSGKCVDIYHDGDHCGRCDNKCNGTQCSFGLCNYA